jgi:putative ABC transport system substrate-binding protein
MRLRFLGALIILASIIHVAPTAPGAQPAKVPRIGVLLLADLELVQSSFREGLRDVGLIEGQNILVEYRSAVGQVDRLTDLAVDLVRLKVDVIVARATPAVQAAKRATTEIPIVMAPAGDPVGTGLVASLGRPGGNVTGLSATSADLGGKLLQLIREARPSITKVVVLMHRTDPFARPFLEQIKSASGRVGVDIRAVVVGGADEFDSAFTAIAKERAGGLVIQPILATKRAADLALKQRLPSITTGVSVRAFPELGGLMSYGANPAEYYRRAAIYVDKILKGAKPADLPVEQPTQFELVINMKTAQMLGLTISPSLVHRADHLIQ